MQSEFLTICGRDEVIESNYGTANLTGLHGPHLPCFVPYQKTTTASTARSGKQVKVLEKMSLVAFPTSSKESVGSCWIAIQ